MLSTEELQRYDRQVCLPGWGREGQERLKAATVFVAGAGGLGSPVALYLAAAGVGTLRVCDCGTPHISNLNRQLLHSDAAIGENKADSAREFLARTNPHVRVEALPEPITPESADELVGPSHIIVDCLDNFTTRHILNRVAVTRGLPLVHAGIHGLCGQLTVLHPPETPCLACVFPESSRQDGLPPVAGPTAGVIGSMEALETIKLLLGLGTSLQGALLLWDGENGECTRVPIARNPACRVCSTEQDFTHGPNHTTHRRPDP